MARPLRVHIPGALYHVMSRGNARQAIFLDADDYEYFLERPSLDRLFAGLRDVDAIDSAISDAFERHGYTLREIGEFLGRPPATVWRRVRRSAVTRRSGRC